MKITKRDIKFFLLGFLFLFLLELFFSWSRVTNAFKTGFSDGYNDASKKEITK